MKVEDIKIYGTHEDNTLNQIKRCVVDERVSKAVLCADGHLGYAVPIGGVIGYRDAISPSGVGFDIACGNKAVLTDMKGEELRKNIKPIMDDVWSTLSFGVGRKNNENVEHEIFDKNYPGWSHESVKDLKRMAQGQLGTIGSGNHYVDLFTDEEDRVWIGVHFGSRGLGHKAATWFLKKAGAKDGIDVDPCVLNLNTNLGQEYLQVMDLAGKYAYAGRNWVCSRVAKLLGATVLQAVHNHHNFAWEEEHNGEKLWVVRKGATPARPGQKGFVGGSMGDISVILEGVQSTEGVESLYSTIHGAGRVMGRMEAKGKKNKQGQVVREGKVSQEMMTEWVTRANVELRGAGVDESPHCYRRLPDVLADHAGTINILHVLTPVGVAMAGKDEFDPFKD